MVHDVRVSLQVVEQLSKSGNLPIVKQLWKDDQQTRVQFYFLVEPTKVSRVAGDKGEVGVDCQFDQEPVRGAGMSDARNMAGFEPAGACYIDEIRSEAFIDQELDHRSTASGSSEIPCASAQRRTASMPSSGSEG